jgi:hypothetical protein
MLRASRAILIPMFTSLLLVACEGGRTPPNPTPLDPWYGTAGNVLISDRGWDLDGTIDYLWIGFNSSESWQAFLDLKARYPAGGYWMCGRVVVLSSHPPGFYFDPDSTGVAEVTAEVQQTSIDFIKSDPAKFTEGPLPGMDSSWCVPTVLERIAPSP